MRARQPVPAEPAPDEMKNKVLVEFVVKTVFEGFFSHIFPQSKSFKSLTLLRPNHNVSLI